MLEATIGNKTITVEKENASYILDKQKPEIDLHKVDSNSWNVLVNGQSHEAVLLEINKEEKTAVFAINGKRCEVAVRTEMDRLLKEMGFENALQQKIDTIKAPMPGLIKSIEVSIGDTVEKGDPLLILEAMKMENVLKSPGPGTITSIAVEAGMTVEKGEVLVKF